MLRLQTDIIIPGDWTTVLQKKQTNTVRRSRMTDDEIGDRDREIIRSYTPSRLARFSAT